MSLDRQRSGAGVQGARLEYQLRLKIAEQALEVAFDASDAVRTVVAEARSRKLSRRSSGTVALISAKIDQIPVGLSIHREQLDAPSGQFRRCASAVVKNSGQLAKGFCRSTRNHLINLATGGRDDSERTHAYRRVIETLAELGPAKLQAAEQERIRYAADSLIFCADLFDDDAARDSLEDTELLCEVLVESGRWERVTADRLIEDLRACGPELPVDLTQAA